MTKPNLDQLSERVEKLSGGSGIQWPSLTKEERELAEAPIDESKIPEWLFTLRPEEDWIRKHRLEREGEKDKLLARQSVEDLALAVGIVREWFPGEFTERGERTAVALLFEAIEIDKGSQNPDEFKYTPSWIFSLVPEIHKTRKGLIHQYRRAMTMNHGDLI